MTQYTTGVNFNSNTGFYEVSSVDSSGNVTTQSVNFSTLCMMFSLDSLNAQDEVFASQFAEAEAQVNQLTMINDCMQMLNKYNNSFSPDDDGNDKAVYLEGHATADTPGAQSTTLDGVTVYYMPGTDMDTWVNVYYPGLVQSGLVEDGTSATSGVGVDGYFTKDELSNVMKNLQTAQSTVSSQNEQQMLLTNDAANKRSTILQQAQTLLQAAQDARNSAAKT